MQQFVQKGMKMEASAELVPAYTVSGTVVTCHRSVSPASAGAAVPAKAEALTQAELQMVEASFQAPGCRQCQGPFSDTRRDGFLFCRRRAVLDELSLQVEELWEEVSSVHSIREYEREIDKDLL